LEVFSSTQEYIHGESFPNGRRFTVGHHSCISRSCSEHVRRSYLQRNCFRKTNLHLKLWESSDGSARIAVSYLLRQTQPINSARAGRKKCYIPYSICGPLLQATEAALACRAEPKSIQELSFDTDGGKHSLTERFSRRAR